MYLGLRPEKEPLLRRVREIVRDEIMPREPDYWAEVEKGDRWQFTEVQMDILEHLKALAKKEELFNLWWSDNPEGHALTTVEYAYFAEEMGKTPLAAEVFNCNAPDTGNMEVFARYGSPDMQERRLKP